MAGRDNVSDMRGFVDEFAVGAFEHIADEDGVVWSQYGVSSQPAFVFIDDAGGVETVIGSLGADGLSSRIEALIG